MRHQTAENSPDPVAIVGGGPAGLALALSLAENGLRSVIIEKEARLGGRAGDWACMATDRCQKCFCCSIQDMVAEVAASGNIETLLGSELTAVPAFDRDLKTVKVINPSSDGERTLAVSALALAAGFEPFDAREKPLLGYGRIEGVFTLADVDAMVRQDRLDYFAGGHSPLRIAFLQCVGSRDAGIGANYCSQYCCKAALRMALKLMDRIPSAEVTIFYLDLQAADRRGRPLADMAVEKGVRLIQGAPAEITPLEDNTLEVITEQEGRNVKESFHRIVLSVGQRPSASGRGLAAMMGLSTDEFGFVRSLDWTDNGRTGTPGLYVAGAVSGPKDIETTLSHAGRTAAAIISDLRESGIL